MSAGAVVAVFLLAALACGATAGWSWQRRTNTPAAATLAVLLVAAATWAMCVALLYTGLPAPVDRVVHVVNYAAIHVLVASMLLLTWSIVDPAWRLRRGRALAFCLAPVLVVLAVATDPWHHLFFSTYVRTDAHPRLVFGPLFWVHSAYCYTLLSTGMLRLVRAWWRASWIFRKQLGSTIVAALAPTVLNAVTLGARDFLGGVDYTPVFFVLTGVIMCHAIFGQGLLLVVPVARAQVVDTILDGVLVIDPAGRLVDSNTAARAMLRELRPDLPAELGGMPAEHVFGHDVLRPLLHQSCQRTVEVVSGLHLDLRSSVLLDQRGHLLARVITARDVSELVLTERRLREQLTTIENLQEQLQEEAARDPLTGLHNRRHLMAVLDAALLHEEPLGLVLLDVDHFKSVNDTHGHQVGDEVLRAVAQELLQATRAGDTVARYGGEEFVILLPGADTATALRRAEKVRARIAARQVALPGADTAQRNLSVTVSAGVAVVPAHAATAHTLIAAADKALYAAKTGGRDRVATAPAAVPATPPHGQASAADADA